ncbi:hypothetical protein M5K25_021433 [Dendrobium thyrsiflorum]|uniref:Uncharacterized protein n=1 Tax=Dendrobium thyrsiflorum TaxID=117978 RepID=A0ABD0UJB6_DENTH
MRYGVWPVAASPSTTAAWPPNMLGLLAYCAGFLVYHAGFLAYPPSRLNPELKKKKKGGRVRISEVSRHGQQQRGRADRRSENEQFPPEKSTGNRRFSCRASQAETW